MKYKNIVFDFGNVLATFDETYILSQFCSSKSELGILRPIIFENWAKLDEGTIEYKTAVEFALSKTPDDLKSNLLDCFENWHQHMISLPQTFAFIKELKANGYGIYLLSNAPVQFTEIAEKRYQILKDFDGIVFSGPLKISKPKPEIYQYLFDTYHLSPEECFFIDDRKDNIQTGKSLGMDGIIFTGDIEAVKKAIDFNYVE